MAQSLLGRVCWVELQGSTMSSVLKTVVLWVVLLGAGACYVTKIYKCMDDSSCPGGSFCLKPSADEVGFCSWGEWSPDDAGAWAILPSFWVSSYPLVLENDPEDPKLKRVETSVGVFRLSVYTWAAVADATFSVSDGVSIHCTLEPNESGGYRTYQQCTMNVRYSGEYIIRVSVEGDHGTNTLTFLWTVKMS